MATAHDRRSRATLAGIAAAAVVLLAACSPKGEKLYQRAEQAMDEGRYREA